MHKKLLGIVLDFLGREGRIVPTGRALFIHLKSLFMKKRILSCALVAASVGALFAFSHMQTAITGKVTPPDGADAVWIIGGTDSVKGMLNSGNFSFTVRPGTYKILVDGKEPYKDVFVENIQVKEGAAVDVGEIVLKK